MSRRVGRVIIASAVLAVASLSPGAVAQADPIHPEIGLPDHRPVSGFGSVVTQDLYNGLASVVEYGGELVLGSYDGVIPAGAGAFVETRAGGPLIPRARDQAEGVEALTAASTGTFLTTSRGTSEGPLSVWDVQFARATHLSSPYPDGWLSYVPMAHDAVTYAVHEDNSSVPRDLTWQDLWYVYTARDGASARLSVGEFTVGRPGSGADIVPLLPPVGSGLRATWLSVIGVNSEGNLGSAVSAQFDGQLVGTDDGSALEAVPNAVMPFSVGHYLGQSRHAELAARYGISVTDQRSGAVLCRVDGVSPVAGDELNIAFPLVYPLFTVVRHGAIATNPDLRRLFVDDPASSEIEGSAYFAEAYDGRFVIEDFGFGSLVNRATEINGREINGYLYRAGDAENFRSIS